MRLVVAFAIWFLLVAGTEGAIKKRNPITEGPDLPYSCATVRFWASVMTAEQLEAWGRANGVILTAKQRRQARACLGLG